MVNEEPVPSVDGRDIAPRGAACAYCKQPWPHKQEEPVNTSTIQATVIKDAVKAAGVVVVILGFVPVILQALGAVHIVVPAAVLGYATIATAVLTAFLSWAKAKGYQAKVTKKVAAKFHKS